MMVENQSLDVVKDDMLPWYCLSIKLRLDRRQNWIACGRSGGLKANRFSRSGKTVNVWGALDGCEWRWKPTKHLQLSVAITSNIHKFPFWSTVSGQCIFSPSLWQLWNKKIRKTNHYIFTDINVHCLSFSHIFSSIVFLWSICFNCFHGSYPLRKLYGETKVNIKNGLHHLLLSLISSSTTHNVWHFSQFI